MELELLFPERTRERLEVQRHTLTKNVRDQISPLQLQPAIVNLPGSACTDVHNIGFE